MDEQDLRNLAASLVEHVRALATRLAGNPDQETLCHFCGGPLPLWQNLLVQQLTGVAAHASCPPEVLAARLKEVGPVEEFPYEEFSRAVDRRLERPSPTSCSGTIESHAELDRPG